MEIFATFGKRTKDPNHRILAPQGSRFTRGP